MPIRDQTPACRLLPLLHVVALLSALACTAGEAGSRAGADDRYVMVSADGLPLPAAIGVAPDCADTLAGGEYRLTDSRWTLEERYRHQCQTKAPATHSSTGILRRAGDTLEFFGLLEKGDTVLWQRGVLTADTLRAGAQLFDGPPYVFVRAMRP